MSNKHKSLPSDFQSYLGGVFWQQWEEDFGGDPAAALKGAGYPSGINSPASQSMSELFKWIEKSSELKSKFPNLDLFYDYEADGLTILEFLVLTKRFMDGNTNAFESSEVKSDSSEA